MCVSPTPAARPLSRESDRDAYPTRGGEGGAHGAAGHCRAAAVGGVGVSASLVGGAGASPPLVVAASSAPRHKHSSSVRSRASASEAGAGGGGGVGVSHDLAVLRETLVSLPAPPAR